MHLEPSAIARSAVLFALAGLCEIGGGIGVAVIMSAPRP
jgi:hypothetical protein